MREDVAVVGTGITPGEDKRKDADIPTLMREAAQDALADADLTPQDLDAVVVGNAGEFFAGTNMPDLFGLSEIHADGLPEMRIHTGGTAGASTGLAGFYHAASGLYDTVMVVTFEKLGDVNAQQALSTVYHPIFQRQYGAGAPSAAGAQAMRYIHKYGSDKTEYQAAKIAAKQRRCAMEVPYAQLKMELEPDEIMESPPLSTPVKFLDTCPATDGACAMIFQTADAAREAAGQPAWVTGVGAITDGVNQPHRDWADPEACVKAGRKAYEMAGVEDPVRDFDVLELYDAFSFQEIIWHEALGFADRGEGGSLIDEGMTTPDGEIPTCPSGGVLCHNPIGATALIRQAEAARQVMGTADHQIPDVDRSLGHGWGGVIQFFTAMIFETTPQGEPP